MRDPRRSRPKRARKRNDDAAAATELRMLQPRPAARLGRSADLLVRMHLLPRLRPGHPEWTLPELRRRAGGAAAAPGRPAGEVSCFDAEDLQTGRMQAGGMKSAGRM